MLWAAATQPGWNSLSFLPGQNFCSESISQAVTATTITTKPWGWVYRRPLRLGSPHCWYCCLHLSHVRHENRPQNDHLSSDHHSSCSIPVSWLCHFLPITECLLNNKFSGPEGNTVGFLYNQPSLMGVQPGWSLLVSSSQCFAVQRLFLRVSVSIWVCLSSAHPESALYIIPPSCVRMHFPSCASFCYFLYVSYILISLRYNYNIPILTDYWHLPRDPGSSANLINVTFIPP